MFSNLLTLTLIPGLCVGFINAKYKHKAALFVWIVPTVVLMYHLFAFPTAVFQDHWSSAFRYYFAGGFQISEFYSYRDLFTKIAGSADLRRGLAQLNSTGPFYAAIGYSLAALLAPRFLNRPKAEALTDTTEN